MESGGASTVQTAITSMATTIANDGVAMITAVIPVLAPLFAAAIIAGIGFAFVKKFGKKSGSAA